MAKIFYQEDCNLSLLEGKTIAIIGYGRSCTCTEPEGFRMSCYHRSVRGLQVLGKG